MIHNNGRPMYIDDKTGLVTKSDRIKYRVIAKAPEEGVVLTIDDVETKFKLDRLYWWYTMLALLTNDFGYKAKVITGYVPPEFSDNQDPDHSNFCTLDIGFYRGKRGRSHGWHLEKSLISRLVYWLPVRVLRKHETVYHFTFFSGRENIKDLEFFISQLIPELDKTTVYNVNTVDRLQ